MSSGPDISHFNALGLSVSGYYSGPSIPTRDGRLRNDSPLSTISSSTLSDIRASRPEAATRRIRNLSRFPDLILPDSIPFPMGPPRFNNSRNPTAFTPRDLRTTIANSISSDQAAAKPDGGLSRVWYRTLRHLAISALKAKFPCLGNQDPVDPLLQSADEILRLDPMLGKVLTSLSMAELIESHSLHLHVKKEIEPWFRDCQIPKPWIGNPARQLGRAMWKDHGLEGYAAAGAASASAGAVFSSVYLFLGPQARRPDRLH
ncbi:hypothetical protein QFC20_001362 [Naganishia adeliensis]|uniref:Uncharacterized protein n=1 Tax=Naganishia adeliensis TaxID=92952 RepID=A0ACC2WRT5_9TREE|nr:hypothetical protein QFC20_001362 [Naganishia adeliensis]